MCFTEETMSSPPPRTLSLPPVQVGTAAAAPSHPLRRCVASGSAYAHAGGRAFAVRTPHNACEHGGPREPHLQPIRLAAAQPGVHLSQALPFGSLTCEMGMLSAP